MKQQAAIALAALGFCVTLVSASAEQSSPQRTSSAATGRAVVQTLSKTAFVYSLVAVTPGTVIGTPPRGNQ